MVLVGITSEDFGLLKRVLKKCNRVYVALVVKKRRLGMGVVELEAEIIVELLNVRGVLEWMH